MLYRVCKSFEIESGHMLSKHPGLCRFPHGHTRRVEVVLCSEALDAQDMVCDFKTLKLALREHLARLDHAMAVNSDDPMLPALTGEATGGTARRRVVTFEHQDPTTEVLARSIFEFLDGELRAGRTYRDEQGLEYRFPPGLRLERVRVSETSSTWAEYGR
jgi:6-pyruvoyltetrahydropterin/6-carboxytetrahydropterin synthase